MDWMEKVKTDDPKEKSKPYFHQINYILCKSRMKGTLRYARVYGGTTTYSDHKIVVTGFELTKRFLCFPKKCDKKLSKLKCQTLTSNTEQRINYRLETEKNINELSYYGNDPDAKIETILSALKKSAQDTIGKINSNKKDKLNDPIITKLSQQRQRLVQLLSNKNTKNRQDCGRE